MANVELHITEMGENSKPFSSAIFYLLLNNSQWGLAYIGHAIKPVFIQHYLAAL